MGQISEVCISYTGAVASTGCQVSPDAQLLKHIGLGHIGHVFTLFW